MKKYNDYIFYATPEPVVEDLRQQIEELEAKCEEQSGFEKESHELYEKHRALTVSNTKLCWVSRRQCISLNLPAL